MLKLAILSGWKAGTPLKLRRHLLARVYNPYKEPVRKADMYINWGTRYETLIPDKKVLNNRNAVDLCVNKLRTLQTLTKNNVPTLEWTTTLNEALGWVRAGRSVFARQLIEGSGGEGIVLIKASEYKKGSISEDLSKQLSTCKLFTRNFPKEEEVRVHIFKGSVIDYQVKRRMSPVKLRNDGIEVDKPDFWVRNHGNGWVFCHEDVTRNKNAEAAAQLAVETLGLDFGAIDVLVGGEGEVVVCEVNTAPALEGQTLDAYVKCFKKLKEIKL